MAAAQGTAGRTATELPHGTSELPVLRSHIMPHVLRKIIKDMLNWSGMGYKKASILLGGAFVVFSVTLRDLTSQKALSIPSLCSMVCSFPTLLLATLSVLPSIGGRRPPEDRRDLFFFGVFGHYSEQDCTFRGMAVLRDDELVYRAMLRDL